MGTSFGYMDRVTPKQLLDQLREQDESFRIEAKRGNDVGSSAMQTVCAFANEPGLGGGYLLFGVCEPDDAHSTFWVCGVKNADKLQNELHNNCRNQFEQSILVQAEVATLEGQRVVSVFVPELEPVAKPCIFKGKFDSKNKRKTGAWRRGLNGDYECTSAELEPLLLARNGLNFEQIILPDANWDDLDPSVIVLYRHLRAQVRPNAEELQASDPDMLRALNLVQKRNNLWVPNIAGLLLLGKSLSLRRLLPAVRVDYVRIAGTQWVEDPNQRFEVTLDVREPLLRLIPKLEATILDDLPRYFHLEEGSIQRSDKPLLPQKVIREAIVNAVMHRDYRVHQPILVVRFSNRIEIRNAGYSLKPEAMLGEMGSELRNPVLASVLYEINFAETKGSGIRTMRKLLEKAGLTAPVFSSDVIGNQFSAKYLLHQLLGEEQLRWLKQYHPLNLSNNEAKALILAKEMGAIDNAGLRAITGLDTLAASQVLSRLFHQHHLLTRGGSGPATFYKLSSDELSLSIKSDENTSDLGANTSDLEPNTSDLEPNTSDFEPNTSDLEPNTSDLGPNASGFAACERVLPSELTQMIRQLTPKARRQTLWPIIVWLCSLQGYKAEQLADLLGRQTIALKTSHLNVLREQEKLIDYVYPEVPNHPEQAYRTTEKGQAWLLQQGIVL